MANLEPLIKEVDAEIDRLQRVRDLLATLLATDLQPWLAHPKISKEREMMTARNRTRNQKRHEQRKVKGKK